METPTLSYSNKVKSLGRFFAQTDKGAYTFAVADDELLQQNINQNLLQLAANQNNKLAVVNIKQLATKDKAPIAALRHYLKEQKDIDGLIITNLYGLLISKEYPDFLTQLNFVREALIKLNLPILFWINNEMIPLLARQAKDLYAQRHNFNLYFTETANRSNELQADQYIAIERSKAVPNKQQHESRLKLLFKQLATAENNGEDKADIANDIVIEILDVYRQLPQMSGSFLRLYDEYKNYFSSKDAWINYVLAYGLNSINRNKSETYYKKSIALNREYLKDNPKRYVSFFPESLNDLANIQSKKNELNWAEQSYKEALSVKRKFPGKKSKKFFSEFAAISNNLGSLLIEKHKFSEAETTFLEVLKLKKHLVKKDYEKNVFDFALALNNLGGLYFYTGRLDLSEKKLLEALTIYRSTKIAKFNNLQFDLANTLNNLGILYQNMKVFEKAKIFHKEALEIRKYMIETEPATYLPCVADSLNNLGTLYREIKKYKKAEKYYNEALKIRLQLAKDHPLSYEIQLADTYLCFSNLYTNNLIDKKYSLQNAQKAAKIYQKYITTVPHAKKWLQIAQANIKHWQQQNKS